MIRFRPLAALALACALLAPTAHAHDYNSIAAPPGSPFKPYEFLVGDWIVTARGSTEPLVILRFAWGPNRTYLTYSGYFIAGGKEHPHFDGVLMWNGVHKNLDMLLCVDMARGLAQEQGTMSIGADGVVVRDITAVYSEGVQPMGEAKAGPGGATGHFRQTFRPIDDDHIMTDALRQAGSGWALTFPGGDQLLMTRKE